MNTKLLHNVLFQRYKLFQIDEEIIHVAIDKAINENKEDALFLASRIIEKQIIDMAKDDIDIEIKIIDVYKKIIAIISKKYPLNKSELNQIYESSIEKCIENYDENQLLSINIIRNMKEEIKKIINPFKEKQQKETIISMKSKITEKVENKDLIENQEQTNEVNEETMISIESDLKEKIKVEEETENIEQVDKKIEQEEKTYDISFFTKYMNRENIDLMDLFFNLDISLDTFNSCRNGKERLDEKNMKLLLSYLKLDSYEDLLKKACDESKIAYYMKKNDIKLESKEQEENKYSYNQEKTYDVSFLRDYVKRKKIDLMDLFFSLDISLDIFNSCMDGKNKLYEKNMRLLLSYLKFDSYEDLLRDVHNETDIVFYMSKNGIEILPEEPKQEKTYDVSFLPDYIKSKNIDLMDLIDNLDISLNKFNSCMIGTDCFYEKNMRLLLLYLKIDSYEDLLKDAGIKDECDIKPEEKTRKVVVKVKKRNFKKKSDLEETILDNAPFIQFIDKEVFFPLIKEELSEFEYLMVQLAFGYFNDSYHSFESISKFLNINNYEIKKICLDALELYKNNFIKQKGKAFRKYKLMNDIEVK